MSREQLRNELPEPVRRYFQEVARMQPPSDLMDAAIADVQAEPRVNRFSWLPALVAVAATLLIGAVIAINVFNIQLGPPVGNTSSPTAEASPSLPAIQTVPSSLDGLPAAGTIEARYPVGDAGFPALAAFDSVWLSNGASGVVSRMDPDTGEITAEIVVNPNPIERYDQNLAADESFVWATGADQTLVKIDPASNTVVDRIDIQRLVYRMQVHGDSIWITDLDSTSSVIRVDKNTGEVTIRQNIPGWTGGLAVTDSDVWVTPYQDERLLRLAPENGELVEEFPVSFAGMAILADGDTLYITGNQSRPLERFSISEGRITARFEETYVVMLDGQLYATKNGALLRLDPETLEVIGAVDFGADVGNALAGDGFLWIPQGNDLIKVRPS